MQGGMGKRKKKKEVASNDSQKILALQKKNRLYSFNIICFIQITSHLSRIGRVEIGQTLPKTFVV
jgi:hypothetical protein